MLKNKKDIIIAVSIGVLILAAFLSKINGYLFMEFLQEAKFVGAAIRMTNIFDIFSPHLNGVQFCDVTPLYYLFLHVSSLIFGSFTEFSARIPSVLVFVSTLFITFILIRRMTNKSYAFIITLTTMSSALLILFATISSPYMLASCFSICAILSAITSTFSNNKKHKQWYYFWFWIGVTLSVLTGGLIEIIFPILVVVPVVIFFRREKDFFLFENFLPGLVFLLVLLYSSLFLTCKINGYEIFVYIPKLLKQVFAIDFCNKHDLCYYQKLLYAFILGVMPWFFSFSAVIISFFVKIISLVRNSNYFVELDMTNQRKVFGFSLWALFVSFVLLIIYPDSNYATLVPIVYFSSMSVAHYWFGYIFSDSHKSSVNAASLLYYVLIILVTVASVIVYFFFSQIQKTYIESLIPCFIITTLFVAIPGLIAIILKRRVFNYAVHILSSILFFFILTGLLFNYVNSFGENDLVNFSIKAKKDGARLVTYDIPNKYSMDYYFKAPVVFNGKMTADEIYKNYGDTTEVYLVLKLADLAYFDKFFVYEIIATGKQYCEITNIKFLPKDEVKANPEDIPDDVN